MSLLMMERSGGGGTSSRVAEDTPPKNNPQKKQPQKKIVSFLADSPRSAMRKTRSARFSKNLHKCKSFACYCQGGAKRGTEELGLEKEEKDQSRRNKQNFFFFVVVVFIPVSSVSCFQFGFVLVFHSPLEITGAKS